MGDSVGREPVPDVLCAAWVIFRLRLFQVPRTVLACFFDFEDRRIPTPCVYMGMLSFAIDLVSVSHI
jgi:hypothetical protein